MIFESITVRASASVISLIIVAFAYSAKFGSEQTLVDIWKRKEITHQLITALEKKKTKNLCRYCHGPRNRENKDIGKIPKC